jgi:hypothetical protein
MWQVKKMQQFDRNSDPEPTEYSSEAYIRALSHTFLINEQIWTVAYSNMKLYGVVVRYLDKYAM